MQIHIQFMGPVDAKAWALGDGEKVLFAAESTWRPQREAALLPTVNSTHFPSPELLKTFRKPHSVFYWDMRNL